MSERFTDFMRSEKRVVEQKFRVNPRCTGIPAPTLRPSGVYSWNCIEAGMHTDINGFLKRVPVNRSQLTDIRWATLIYRYILLHHLRFRECATRKRVMQTAGTSKFAHRTLPSSGASVSSCISDGLIGSRGSDLDKYLLSPVPGVNTWLFSVTCDEGANMPVRTASRSLMSMDVMMPGSKPKVSYTTLLVFIIK